jgi:fucose permease
LFEKIEEHKRRLAILCLLYAGFVSLGMTDAVLGVAWPGMRLDFGLPLEAAGLLVGITKIVGIISCLVYGYLGGRWHVGRIMLAFALILAAEFFGYAASPWWWLIVILTVPAGFGIGAMASAVNAYAAKYCSSRDMALVNCVWGIGVTCSTVMMTSIFRSGHSWRTGYAVIAAVMALASMVFLVTLGVWRGRSCVDEGRSAVDIASVFGGEFQRVVLPSLGKYRRVFAANCLYSVAYSGVELAPGLWGTTFLLDVTGASMEMAGLSVSLYWAFLTAGRALAGVLAPRVSDVGVLRGGITTASLGIAILIAARNSYAAMGAFSLIGLGLGPLFPLMLHDVSRRVGDVSASRMIGAMLGANYLGAAVLPALMGFIASRASILVMGPMMAFFIAAVAASHEISAFNALYKRVRTHTAP